MAGKNQHFFPQFPLKGFASRVYNRQVYTQVFRKGRAVPFETNIPERRR